MTQMFMVMDECSVSMIPWVLAKPAGDAAFSS